MGEKSLKIVVGFDAIFVRQRFYPARVCSHDRSGTKLGNSQSGANVSVGDVAAADESYLKHSIYESAPAFCSSSFMPAQL